MPSRSTRGTVVVALMLAGCSADDQVLRSKASDAQVSEPAGDAGCDVCLAYDSGATHPVDAGRDAGSADPDSCKLTTRPACTRVACTWDEAKQKIPECLAAPVVATPHYASRCGDFAALAYQGTDSIAFHIYDRAGRLAAIRSIGIGASCVVFEQDFPVPERCTMVTPSCPLEEDAGS